MSAGRTSALTSFPPTIEFAPDSPLEEDTAELAYAYLFLLMQDPGNPKIL
jgi:hypothetical protein